MEILQEDFATITLHRTDSLLEVSWLRQPSEEEFKHAYGLSLDTAIAEKLRYYLSDNSAGITLVIAMQHWVSGYCLEKLRQLKLVRYARVVPPDPMHEIVSYKIFDYLNGLNPCPFDFRVFYRKIEALQWLLNGEVRQANQ